MKNFRSLSFAPAFLTLSLLPSAILAVSPARAQNDASSSQAAASAKQTQAHYIGQAVNDGDLKRIDALSSEILGNSASTNEERGAAYLGQTYKLLVTGASDTDVQASLDRFHDAEKLAPKDSFLHGWKHWIDRNFEFRRKEVHDNYWHPFDRKYAVKSGDTDGFWQTAEPASLGISPAAIESYRGLCERSGADAYLVIYKGKIISEGYSQDAKPVMNLYDGSCAWAGLIAGALVADGKLASVDDPVRKYLPAWESGERAGVTVRNLLTMTSGLPTWLRRPMWQDDDHIVNDIWHTVSELSVDRKPGESWRYSEIGVQVLSPVFEKAAGEPVQDYAKRRLFDPLGMADTALRTDEKGHANVAGKAQTTLRDFGRIGMLLRNNGQWQGKQILPESWIRDSTTGTSLNRGFGYLLSLDDWGGEPNVSFGSYGAYQNDCIVFPSRDLVLIRMQRRTNNFENYFPSYALTWVQASFPIMSPSQAARETGK